jgi:hypothetical protein
MKHGQYVCFNLLILMTACIQGEELIDNDPDSCCYCQPGKFLKVYMICEGWEVVEY